MANPNQFDLNAEIQAWRDSLASSPEVSLENLNELESHLRDSIATLRDKGLTEAEAFHIATQRIGSPPALQPEFAKVNAREVWLDRLLWMVLGTQLWFLITAFSRTAATWTVVGGLKALGYDFSADFAPGFGRMKPSGFNFLASGTGVMTLLISFAQIAMVGLSIWVCARLVQRGKAKLSKIARRPRALWGLLFLGGLAFITAFLAAYADRALLYTQLPSNQVTTVLVSRSQAYLFVGFAQMVAVLVITGILIRRFFRNRSQRA